MVFLQMISHCVLKGSSHCRLLTKAVSNSDEGNFLPGKSAYPLLLGREHWEGIIPYILEF